MSKVIKFLVTAAIFLSAALFLQWQIGSTFGATSPGVGGLVAITIIALLGAWEYARSERKKWHHYAIAFACCVYLAYGWWHTKGLNPSQRTGRTNELEYQRQAMENKASAGRHADIIATDRKAELQRRRANKPEVVRLIRDAQRDDFRDEAGVMIPFPYTAGTTEVPFPLVAGTQILYWPFPFKEFEGEEYVLIKVYDKPMIKGYFRFFELDESIQRAEQPGDTVPAPAAHQAVAVPVGTMATVTAVQTPSAAGLEVQTVTAKSDSTWTISDLLVKPGQTVFYGPFSSISEGERIKVCVSGGPPLTLQPYQWPNGRYGGHVTWQGVSQVPWKAWVRLESGVPQQVTLTTRKPY